MNPRRKTFGGVDESMVGVNGGVPWKKDKEKGEKKKNYQEKKIVCFFFWG